MRKIFVMFALAAVFIIQMTPASAKEVFVGTDRWLDLFVDTNTIDRINSYDFYVDVNAYNGKGDVEYTDEWHFYTSNFNKNAAWFFDREYLGQRIPVSQNELAAKILRACQTHNTQISS